MTTRFALTDEQLAALDPGPGERGWLPLAAPRPDWSLWLLAWGPGSGTGWHDHGGSAGAFAVVSGLLTERSVARAWTGTAGDVPLADGAIRERAVAGGQTRSFGPGLIHEVLNLGSQTAYSLHVYAPELPLMHRYEVRGDTLVHIGTERDGGDW